MAYISSCFFFFDYRCISSFVMVFCMHMPPDIDVFFLWCCFFFLCVCMCANVLKENLFFFPSF